MNHRLIRASQMAHDPDLASYLFDQAVGCDEGLDPLNILLQRELDREEDLRREPEPTTRHRIFRRNPS
jgi:hypothetical protein